MNILIATQNKGKINEIKKIFSSYPVQLFALSDFPEFSGLKFQENGHTLKENAELKARQALQYMKAKGMEHDFRYVASEDSGLFVDSLNGRPGIYSARFSGENATNEMNLYKLMAEMKNHTNRKAVFKAVVCAMSAEGEAHFFEGELKGTISHEARGKMGFGYDPVFIPTGFRSTLAELGEEVKNTLSHRKTAWENFIKALNTIRR